MESSLDLHKTPSKAVPQFLSCWYRLSLQRGSDDLIEDAFGSEGEHEAGEAAEDHADADECADDPDGAGGPGTPYHDGKNEGDDAVDQKPAGAVAGAELEDMDDLDDAFEEKIGGEDEGQARAGREWMHKMRKTPVMM